MAIVEKKLSYDVVGCAQRVHSALGPGFPEAVYQRALCRELVKARIPFESQPVFEVAYDGSVCGTFRVDVFVQEKIILELKAVEALCRQHEAQALAYLKASGAKVAILMNFGEASLKVKRFVL
ncbi:MAG: GxxExxY protein [Planctomycetota bacterium]|jgi:GxxExxY protein